MRRVVPAHIGGYLAGLIDGEGCFSIHRGGRSGYRCAFIIKLRADDKPLLDWLCSEFGLGRVRLEAPPSRYHPCARWEITKKSELVELIDVLADYPLRSKKARDFRIWTKAVEAWFAMQKGEAADWSEIERLAAELRAVRAYSANRAHRPVAA